VSKKANGTLLLKPYDLQQIVQVHGLLIQDPPTPLTTEMLALAVGLNRNKLHYGFKQHYGVTIHAFRIQQNMEKAQCLLATTQHPIKTISKMVGYKNSSDFVYAFKQQFGMTPSVYRKQVITIDDNSTTEAA
jgi:AraC-like DNA-binding protein